MFKIILWDVDNTLLSFTKAESYSLKKRFEEFGLGECTDAMVRRYSEINNTFWLQLETLAMPRERMLEARFEAFFAEAGIVCSDVKAFNEAYETGLADRIFYNENSQELVRSLKGRVLQYAVTNGSEAVQTVRLKKSGFSDLLDGCFISEVVGADKPNKTFFDKVLSSVPAAEKDEILIVGDSLSGDMQGGINAGIKTCWYNPLNEITDLIVDYEIHSLNEVLNILEVG